MPRKNTYTQSAILERVIQPAGGTMTRAAAKSLVKLEFTPSDHRRMSRLLAAAQAGSLTTAQAVELENYRIVGRMVDLLRSKARQMLKPSPAR